MSSQGFNEAGDRVWARLTRQQSLRGLRGQRLGTVGWCAVDLASGRIEAVELRTPWQTLVIPWRRVARDEGDADLRLLADSASAGSQDASD